MSKTSTTTNKQVIKEVNQLIEMFDHISFSLRFNGLENNNLILFGFPDHTPHYSVYRDIKLTKEEQKNQPWRYRNQDNFSLEKMRAIHKNYKKLIPFFKLKNLTSMTINQLATLYPVGLTKIGEKHNNEKIAS